MDVLMLDGNAIAGLLQEVFAAEMTTAIGICGDCGAAGPVGATSPARRRHQGFGNPSRCCHAVDTETDPRAV